MNEHLAVHKQGRDGAVSSIRIEEKGPHWHVWVFNRGALAGTLVVNADDGPAIVECLLPKRLRSAIS